MRGDLGERYEHKQARQIASDWHDGGGSALYVLTSTGAIVLNDQGMEWLNVRAEIQGCIDYIDNPDTRFDEHWTREVADRDRRNLVWLLKYVDKYGSRGPVEGWGKLSW